MKNKNVSRHRNPTKYLLIPHKLTKKSSFVTVEGHSEPECFEEIISLLGVDYHHVNISLS